MPRRKTGQENIRNLQRSRGSYHVSLPLGYVRELGWQERQKVTVKKLGKRLIIEDWRK